MNIDGLKNKAKKAVEEFVKTSSTGDNWPPVFIIPQVEVDAS